MMQVLREHSTLQLPIDFDIIGFERYLNDVWKSRHSYYEDDDIADEISTDQSFLMFHRNSQIKAGQYVGFIQFGKLNLSIYPKIFESIHTTESIKFYKHLVYWLSYCRKINFPFSNVIADLDKVDDFPEALIYYFAKQTLTLIQSAPYHQFELVEETLKDVKGRLLINRYIVESLVSGNYHKMICEHEPLQFDNQLNRIIKNVARMLLHKCRFKETWYLLEQIVFVLDDASDKSINESDCDKIILNPLFSDYKECLDMCRFFLSNEQIRDVGGVNDHYCFLLPMNYVFEDYICGFIEDKFKGQFHALYQYSNWLTEQKIFRIKNDLILENNQHDLLLIIDTKYKIRDREKDAKKGISQNDLYQMLSYAIRNNCHKVLLLYPKMHNDDSLNEIDTFTISSEMLEKVVTVYAADVCVSSDDITLLDTTVYTQLLTIINKTLEQHFNKSSTVIAIHPTS